jgi:peptide/nickel transport system ATP-binding protein
MTAAVAAAQPSPEVSPASPNVVETNALKKWFDIGRGLFRGSVSLKAVDDVTLAIARGETLAIVGESGSGKTTLGRTVIRLLEPTDGRLLYDGQDITHMPEKQLMWLRRKAQMIPQDPYSSVNPAFPVYRILEEPLVIHKQGDHAEREDAVLKALQSVKLNPPTFFANKYPHMLSGGQRQRVAIARALMLNPEFILADEPVSMLDASVRISILRLLRQIQDKFGIAFLYITHDLATAKHFSDRIGIMYAGRLVEEGPVGGVLGEPLHPYTQALMNAIPDPDPANRMTVRQALPGEPPSLISPPTGCHFHPRCPIAQAGLCDVKDPEMRELRPGHRVACHLAS